MSIAARKERQKEEMKALVLQTAMKLFLEEGFGNVSLRRIAEKIEYSPSTIYLYFKDKDEILYALHTEGFNELYRRQQAIPLTKDPLERIRKHGEVYLKFALENHEYYNLMFIMRSPAKKFENGEVWNVGLRSYEFFRKDVNTAIDAGVFKPADPDVAAFALWSLVHGIVALILRKRCTMMDQDQLPVIAQSALNFVMDNMVGMPTKRSVRRGTRSGVRTP
jgi:AcrR family transcriptional regulator